jgi:hypothetical protein
VKPIETHYKGYRFRSRLEARWAVYFDAEGIEWEYEKEGYRLSYLKGALYLPDFWLPQVSMFAEVKPSAVAKMELAKILALAAESGHSVLLLDGPPDCRSYFAFDHTGGCDDYIVSAYHGYHVDEHRFFCSTGEGNWPTPARGDAVEGAINMASIHAARSARFEHGESGPRNGHRG